MMHIDELDIGHTARPPREPEAVAPSKRVKWIALTVVVLAIGAWLGYSIFQRLRPADVPATETRAEPASGAAPLPVAPRLVEGEQIPLPPLSETDAIVRMLVERLSSQPKVLAWLATKGLIENFTVVTLNISEGRSPVTHLRSLAPKGAFGVRASRGHTVIDPASYRRYDDYAAAVGALDATGTARLYLTLKPRILDAYRQLGYPDADFDAVLERAIGILLAVPIIETDMAVRQKVITYEFADPATEALSPAARQFLRMGPANMRVVQAKLREIAALLGLRPRSSATT